MGMSTFEFFSMKHEKLSQTNPIAYDRAWENNTGYFDGAAIADLGTQIGASTDPQGRMIIIIPLLDGKERSKENGNVVLFQRYAGGEKLVCNVTNRSGLGYYLGHEDLANMEDIVRDLLNAHRGIQWWGQAGYVYINERAATDYRDLRVMSVKLKHIDGQRVGTYVLAQLGNPGHASVEEAMIAFVTEEYEVAITHSGIALGNPRWAYTDGRWYSTTLCDWLYLKNVATFEGVDVEEAKKLGETLKVFLQNSKSQQEMDLLFDVYASGKEFANTRRL